MCQAGDHLLIGLQCLSLRIHQPGKFLRHLIDGAGDLPDLILSFHRKSSRSFHSHGRNSRRQIRKVTGQSSCQKQKIDHKKKQSRKNTHASKLLQMTKNP